jgi:hypothetical protein
MIDLRIATCTSLPEVDADEAPLASALASAGIRAELLAWDDPRVDWDAPIPTVLRSTWNYALSVDAFLAWIDRVARAAPLWNPPAIVRGNVHKRYLAELAARGVAVVPTTVVERGRSLALSHPALPARIVIKPEVGAGSLGTRVFALPSELEDAEAHLASLTRDGAALVQPYVDSVDDYGERSLVWIDGELSHAIRKSPRFAGDAEKIDGPFAIADDERALAEAALAPYAGQLLYARVDLARGAHGRPQIMELEMVEPSLFFNWQPGSVETFVAALARRLAR